MTHLAGIAKDDADYRRIGIGEDIEQWEDGARTDGRSGTYEWWYFDSHLDNGATLVVIFMSKDLSTPGKPLSPVIRLNLDLPDGRRYEIIQDFPAADYSARHDRADVTIGGNIFRGDLEHYEIRAEVGGITVEVTLDAEIRPWRPHTGYMLFGEKRDLEFSWLPSVPQGRVTASYEVDGQRTEVAGIGYHDHNWGNVGMMSIIHDWYWARGQAGPYSVIASYITAHGKYGYEPIPIFMLAKDGEIMADAAENVRFEALDTYTDTRTGKPVATVTRYTYTDGDDEYVVTFRKEKDLAADRFVDQMKGWRKYAAKLIRVDGAYLRFTGKLTVERRKAGETVETFTERAIWELMYFGRAR